MIKHGRTSLVGVARRTVVVVFAGALVSIALSDSAEASAFMIDLLSGSSGGGGGGASGSGGSGTSGSGGSTDAGSGLYGLGSHGLAGMPNVRLGGMQQTSGGILQSPHIVEPTGQSKAGTAEANENLSQTQLAGAAVLALSSSSVAPALTSTVHTPIADLPIADLNLGDGDSLAVSGTVVAALIDNMSGDNVSGNLPVAKGNDERLIAPSGSPNVSGGTNPANPTNPANNDTNSANEASDHAGDASDHAGNADLEVNVAIAAILPEITTGIVSSAREIAAPLNGSSVVANDTVPEPRSLLLLGSGLAVTARLLRRRKHLPSF